MEFKLSCDIEDAELECNVLQKAINSAVDARNKAVEEFFKKNGVTIDNAKNYKLKIEEYKGFQKRYTISNKRGKVLDVTII